MNPAQQLIYNAAFYDENLGRNIPEVRESKLGIERAKQYINQKYIDLSKIGYDQFVQLQTQIDGDDKELLTTEDVLKKYEKITQANTEQLE